MVLLETQICFLYFADYIFFAWDIFQNLLSMLIFFRTIYKQDKSTKVSLWFNKLIKFSEEESN